MWILYFFNFINYFYERIIRNLGLRMLWHNEDVHLIVLHFVKALDNVHVCHEIHVNMIVYSCTWQTCCEVFFFIRRALAWYELFLLSLFFLLLLFSFRYCMLYYIQRKPKSDFKQKSNALLTYKALIPQKGSTSHWLSPSCSQPSGLGMGGLEA